jgi:hypothetical protein
MEGYVSWCWVGVKLRPLFRYFCPGSWDMVLSASLEVDGGATLLLDLVQLKGQDNGLVKGGLDTIRTMGK